MCHTLPWDVLTLALDLPKEHDKIKELANFESHPNWTHYLDIVGSMLQLSSVSVSREYWFKRLVNQIYYPDCIWLFLVSLFPILVEKVANAN